MTQQGSKRDVIQRKLWDGEYHLPEHADIPQWLVDDERRHARNELRAILSRGGADRTAAERRALRVVPDRAAYQQIERERRAATRGVTTPAHESGDEDGMEL